MNSSPCLTTCFANFRIFAWKFIYWARRANNLGPQYDCATCELPERKKAGPLYPNCPGCPLTETRGWLRRQVELECRRRYGKQTLDRWDFRRLERLHALVARLLAENDDRVSKRWDRRTAMLARVIKQERDTVRRWDELAAGDKPKAKK